MLLSIIPKDKQEWIIREKLVACYLKYINKVDFPDEMVNLLKEFLNTGDSEIKRVIDHEYSQEILELIQDENLNMEEPIDRLYSLDTIIDAEFNTDMLRNMSMDGLIETQQQIKRLSDNIVEEYFKRICATQEILLSGEEYNLVFEWIKESTYDLCDFSNAISFYDILYKQEEDNLLPYLSYSKEQNWNVLYDEYFDLLKSFIDTSDDSNIDYTIETYDNAFDLLERYYYKNKDNISENVSAQITSWKEEIGDKCAKIMQDKFDEHNNGLFAEDFENWTDAILEFAPENVIALKMKIWCQEQTIDEYRN